MPQVTGVILAGGKGQRMGGQDKGLVVVAGKPLYEHVLNRLAPQVDSLIINANRNIEQYKSSGYPVVSDRTADFQGPLAGILTGLSASQTEWVLFCACDTPAIPTTLYQTLWQQRKDANAVYAHDGEKAHPTLLLIHQSLKEPLSHFLASGGRKLGLFLQQQQAAIAYFPHQQAQFINLNTPQECIEWEQQYENQN